MRTIIFPALILLTACRSKDVEVIDTGGVTETGDASVDADADGYDESEDCDDANSVVNPGAEEICDGVDNNCDGTVDEGVTSTFYADDDGDGFGDAGSTTEACEVPSGYVATGTDCDDTSSESYPGASEQCDDEDNDCDGTIDEDVRYAWFADADGDGFGDADSAYETCDPPPGYVTDDTDCDDTEDSAFPGGTEVCDTVDNDCDGSTDEDVTTTYYQDTDSDGFGIADVTTSACDLPTGYAADPGDCDDADGAISPNATEVCDDLDNDCDGDADSDAIDQTTFYADDDGDGFGDVSDTTIDCSAPSATVTDATDCDDADSAVNPDAEEVCDGVDNDCDGDIDTDATDLTTYYADSDGDGYGTAVSTTACDQPTGYADNSDDCDDGEAASNPGESEVCDEIDNDCDGDTDEGLTATYYLDYDGDGFGGSFSTIECSAPSGYVSDSTDCDDSESTSNPDATEICDGDDNDCDGTVDEGVTTTFYADADGDGYGDTDDATDDCEAPTGTVTDATDCDDDDAATNPGAEEVCDDVDNDCDGDLSLEQCEDCAAVLSADSTSTDGIYTIDLDGEGGADAFDVYCDMTLDGGGWTMWWWYEAGAGMTGLTDMLGEDLSTCDPSTDTACFGSIPISSPDELMVTNQSGSWAVWEFDGTDTADNALAAFTTQTTTSSSSSVACGDDWTPVAQDGDMTDDPYVCDENNNSDPGCDCFWYDSYSGVYSFYLDDDTGWAETAFGAGYDNSSSLGVDSLETTYRYHSTTAYDLWMFFR
ncbi:MAG: hypothetical protein ACI8RZ_005331 [Myxococcota bacterium]|jgi:hypothetical protein